MTRDQLIAAVRFKNLEYFRSLLDQGNWDADLSDDDKALDYPTDIDAIALSDIVESGLPDSDGLVVSAMRK